MIPAFRSVPRSHGFAEALPWVADLADLYSWVTLRKGQLIMIEGQPGSQKSGFALYLTNQFDLPGLYFAADSSPTTMMSRLGGMRTGMTSEEVLLALHDGGSQAPAIEESLRASKVSFVFDDSPTYDDIEDEITAFVEMFDQYPGFLVIDNLLDIDGGGESGDDWQSWRVSLLWLKGLCRKTGITVIVTHHASESGTDPDWPAPRKAIQGKIAQTPEVILSVALADGGQTFRVSPVKVRDGRSEPMARKGVEMSAVPSKTQFRKRGLYEAPVKSTRSY